MKKIIAFFLSISFITYAAEEQLTKMNSAEHIRSVHAYVPQMATLHIYPDIAIQPVQFMQNDSQKQVLWQIVLPPLQTFSIRGFRSFPFIKFEKLDIA